MVPVQPFKLMPGTEYVYFSLLTDILAILALDPKFNMRNLFREKNLETHSSIYDTPACRELRKGKQWRKGVVYEFEEGFHPIPEEHLDKLCEQAKEFGPLRTFKPTFEYAQSFEEKRWVEFDSKDSPGRSGHWTWRVDLHERKVHVTGPDGKPHVGRMLFGVFYNVILCIFIWSDGK